MATRSTIALEYANGQVDQIYCHWDGYIDHNGVILQEHYLDPFKVQQMMDLGDLSSLGQEIGEQHPFSYIGVMDGADYEKLYGNMCTFYGRDRSETNVSRRRFADFADYKKEHQYEEYEYILRQVDGKPVWFVSEYGRAYIPLTDVIANQMQKAA